jgi:hypothetical protein
MNSQRHIAALILLPIVLLVGACRLVSALPAASALLGMQGQYSCSVLQDFEFSAGPTQKAAAPVRTAASPSGAHAPAPQEPITHRHRMAVLHTVSGCSALLVDSMRTPLGIPTKERILTSSIAVAQKTRFSSVRLRAPPSA